MSDDTRTSQREPGAVQDVSKGYLPITLAITLAVSAAAGGGAIYVTHDKVAEHTVQIGDHEKRLQTSERDSAVRDEKLDRLVRAMDRLEDRLGTKPARETP